MIAKRVVKQRGRYIGPKNPRVDWEDVFRGVAWGFLIGVILIAAFIVIDWGFLGA